MELLNTPSAVPARYYFDASLALLEWILKDLVGRIFPFETDSTKDLVIMKANLRVFEGALLSPMDTSGCAIAPGQNHVHRRRLCKAWNIRFHLASIHEECERTRTIERWTELLKALTAWTYTAQQPTDLTHSRHMYPLPIGSRKRNRKSVRQRKWEVG